MPSYEVRVEYHGACTYYLDAESKEAAEELAEEQFREGEPSTPDVSDYEILDESYAAEIATGDAS